MKVKDLLTDESKWTQNEFARDAKGKRCSSTSSRATQWCIVGAINKCYELGLTHMKMLQLTANHIKSSEPQRANPPLHVNTIISRWNDNPSRTFTDVQALVNRLDI